MTFVLMLKKMHCHWIWLNIKRWRNTWHTDRTRLWMATSITGSTCHRILSLKEYMYQNFAPCIICTNLQRKLSPPDALDASETDNDNDNDNDDHSKHYDFYVHKIWTKLTINSVIGFYKCIHYCYWSSSNCIDEIVQEDRKLQRFTPDIIILELSLCHGQFLYYFVLWL